MYTSPGAVASELAAESRKKLRKCAADLRANQRAIRSYWAFRLLGQLPPEDDVKKAASLLIGLSNVIKAEDNLGIEDQKRAGDDADKLRMLLRMR